MVNFDGRRRQLRWHRQSGEQQRTHRQLLRTEGEEEKVALLLAASCAAVASVGRWFAQTAAGGCCRARREEEEASATNRQKQRKKEQQQLQVGGWKWRDGGAVTGRGRRRTEAWNRRWREEGEEEEELPLERRNRGKNYTLVPSVIIYFLLK